MKKIFIILLFLQSIQLHGSTVDTLNVYSNSMRKEIKNVIVLPNTYMEQGDPFSVVYMLHGYGGDQNTWTVFSPVLKEFADEFRFILVFPDAENSFYLDSPVDTTIKYETYISKELITAIDNEFNTIKNRSGRVIMGGSMGGFGALYLSFKHPNIWCAALSLSGVTDLRLLPEIKNKVPEFQDAPDRFGLSKLLGSRETHPDNWDLYSVINMIPLLNKYENIPALYISCGYDDFLIDMNRDFHDELLKYEIPHVYLEMPGNHFSESIWKESMKYPFVFIEKHLKNLKDEIQD